MVFTPNLGRNGRIAYTIFGLFWLGFGLYSLESGRFLGSLGALAAIVVGVVVAVEGTLGF